MPPRPYGGPHIRGPPTRAPRRPRPSAPRSRTLATSDRPTPMRPLPPHGLDDARGATPPLTAAAWRPTPQTFRTCAATTVATARRATSASMAATRNVDRRWCVAGPVDRAAAAAAVPLPPRPAVRAAPRPPACVRVHLPPPPRPPPPPPCFFSATSGFESRTTDARSATRRDTSPLNGVEPAAVQKGHHKGRHFLHKEAQCQKFASLLRVPTIALAVNPGERRAAQPWHVWGRRREAGDGAAPTHWACGKPCERVQATDGRFRDARRARIASLHCVCC